MEATLQNSSISINKTSRPALLWLRGMDALHVTGVTESDLCGPPQNGILIGKISF